MKLKHYGIALVPICFVVFLFRAMELILTIDTNTGYFTTGAILPLVFDGVLILIAAFFCTVLLRKKEPKPVAVRLYRISLFDMIFGVAASVLLVAAALFNFFGAIAEGTLPSGAGLLLSAKLWQILFSVLAAIFLIFFVTYPRMSAKQNLWRVMSLSVTAYYLFMLLVSFQDLDVVFSRAFGIYQITFYGFAAAAAINFSKILARLFGRKVFIFFTCLATVIATLRLADGVLFLIPGNPYQIPMNLISYLADVCVTVLMLSQMHKILKPIRRKRPAPEAEPAAEERN